MERSIGIAMMITFFISGVAAAALAWLCPSLHLDKTLAVAAGFLGVGFTVYQGIRFRHATHGDENPAPIPDGGQN